MSNSPFCFTSKYKAIWKENLAVDQMSLGAFFHAPLHVIGSFHTVKSSPRISLFPVQFRYHAKEIAEPNVRFPSTFNGHTKLFQMLIEVLTLVNKMKETASKNICSLLITSYFQQTLEMGDSQPSNNIIIVLNSDQSPQDFFGLHNLPAETS